MATKQAHVQYGPMEFVVLGFPGNHFSGKIKPEIQRLQDLKIMRIVGLLLIYKNKDGAIDLLRGSDLPEDEREALGAIAGGLIGYGLVGEEGVEEGVEAGAESVAEHQFGISDKDVHEIANDMPNNYTAAFLLFENQWARHLKEVLLDADGKVLAQGFVNPRTLVEYGKELAQQISVH